MQKALRYLAIFSMIFYCEMNERYSKYLTGIIPLMSAKRIAAIIYANIYLFNKGDEEAIASTIKKFKEEILESSKCLVKRLGYICENDVFINAFVNTQLIMDALDYCNE